MSDLTKPTLCSSYTYEDADITLVSSDNMQFKVYSYLLKTHSPVFRDMLNDSKLTASPITLDLNKSDLKLLLDMMKEDEPKMSQDWPQCKRVIDFCATYECIMVIERLVSRLEAIVHQAPWEVLCVASRYQNINLAKKALGCMRDDTHHKTLSIRSFPLKAASQLTLPYLLGLITHLRTLEETERVWLNSKWNHIADWEEVGKRFEPVT